MTGAPGPGSIVTLAEGLIPKPVMKRYKAFLRDGLFG